MNRAVSCLVPSIPQQTTMRVGMIWPRGRNGQFIRQPRPAHWSQQPLRGLAGQSAMRPLPPEVHFDVLTHLPAWRRPAAVLSQPVRLMRQRDHPDAVHPRDPTRAFLPDSPHLRLGAILPLVTTVPTSPLTAGYVLGTVWKLARYRLPLLSDDGAIHDTWANCCATATATATDTADTRR